MWIPGFSVSGVFGVLNCFFWHSAKQAGVKRACPNKVMAHLWCMHDAYLCCAFLFLDILAEKTLLSMTFMVTPCWNEVGDVLCQVSSSPFHTRPFWRTPILFRHLEEPKRVPKQTSILPLCALQLAPPNARLYTTFAGFATSCEAACGDAMLGTESQVVLPPEL